MFCSNCGAEIHGGKFCSECGAPIQQINPAPQPMQPKEPGHDIKICENCGERMLAQAIKCPHCGVSVKNSPFIKSDDAEHINQIRMNAPHIEVKKGFWERAREQAVEIDARKKTETRNYIPQPTDRPLSKRERIKENKANGIACCPKCGSTSLSANKRGWKITTGILGSSKIIITCMNCGHHWKP